MALIKEYSKGVMKKKRRDTVGIPPLSLGKTAIQNWGYATDVLASRGTGYVADGGTGCAAGEGRSSKDHEKLKFRS